MEKPKIHLGVVIAKEHLASTFYSVRLTLDTPMHFEAGQYVTFHIGPPKQRHTLSIATPPPDGNKIIDVLQSVAPNGPGSKWVLGLNPGDRVTFTGPLGSFTVQKQSERRKIFIATGCGIAPFSSMIADYLQKGGQAQVRLYWGLRHESDIFWLDRLETLAKNYLNFSYKISLSAPKNGWTGLRGRVTNHVLQEEKDLEASEFYLCGRKEMIRDMRSQLSARNVPADHIYTEAFF